VTSIRVEHADGSTDTLTHVRDEVHRRFGTIDLGRLVTTRTDANSITLTEDEDEVYLEEGGSDVFGGILKDIERGGSAVELVVDSFERLAREAEPTDGGDRRENVADDTVVNTAIGDVPDLTAGTVTQIETGLTFVFSHASQAKVIRTVEEATTGEVQYNADKSVDYLTRLGSDKSGSITISPGNQNLDGKIKVIEDGGDRKLTHLRMLGAGEGKHQLEANIVPSADGDSYENKVTYTSSWSSGDRKVWDTYINKEAINQGTLETQGTTLIEELNSKYVEVKATLKGVTVELGDEVQVEKSKDNISRKLRIVEWVRINDNEGLRYECVLSSRQKSRQDGDASDRKDVQKYNKGFEGTPVTLTAGGGRQPVDATHNYLLSFYYPADIHYEHRVNLQVKGLGYRAYSQGAAAGGDHTHDVFVDHPSHSHDVDVTHPSHSHTVDVTHPSHDHFVNIGTTQANNAHGSAVAASGDNISFVSTTSGWDQVETISESGYEFGFVHVMATSAEEVIECRARDSSAANEGDSFPTDAFSPSPNGTALTGQSDTQGESSAVTLAIPEDWGFIDIDVRVPFGDASTNVHVAWILFADHDHDTVGDTSTTALGTTQSETSDAALGTTQSETSDTFLPGTTAESSDASGDHTHSPNPGIIDFANYPSACDVLVNGSSLGLSFGPGGQTFEETVDLAGQLTEGAWNTIEVTSDTLGHLQCSLDIDVYRQILGDG